MTVDREYLHFVDTHIIDHARESLPQLEHVGVPTVFVSTTVDVRSVLPQKKAAIAAHASQVDATSSLMTLSDDSFRNVYGYEWFVRTGPPGVIESLADPPGSTTVFMVAPIGFAGARYRRTNVSLTRATLRDEST